jgi:hypothetical protein
VLRVMSRAQHASRSFLRDNSLSIVIVSFFVLSTVGLSFAGHAHYNDEQRAHGEPTVTLGEYLGRGDFLEALMENWESEFLQMFVFVLLTAFLIQRGSAESKDPDESDPQDRDPRKSSDRKDVPGPVRRGGVALKLYENSLSLTFLVLFLLSFALHALGGVRAYNEEQLAHGEEPASTLEYIGSSQFWFESLQNWQSEFLAIAAVVVLSIFLRQRGSPESKPVDSPHGETGTE